MDEKHVSYRTRPRGIEQRLAAHDDLVDALVTLTAASEGLLPEKGGWPSMERISALRSAVQLSDHILRKNGYRS